MQERGRKKKKGKNIVNRWERKGAHGGGGKKDESFQRIRRGLQAGTAPVSRLLLARMFVLSAAQQMYANSLLPRRHPPPPPTALRVISRGGNNPKRNGWS
ncbi:hypothetical protein R5R35_009590 [Gryllus longicercus]|uniref:Uncharacterized protein n=1 Tax=Gryllus longicercus TaxID=2509291 RepID=A0AAN9YY46_9ORTH